MEILAGSCKKQFSGTFTLPFVITTSVNQVSTANIKLEAAKDQDISTYQNIEILYHSGKTKYI